MRERYYRQLTFFIITIFLAIGFGCSQPDDVIAPVSTTRINIDPEAFPTLATGYVYELWAVDTSGQYSSIGKFIWNQFEFQAYDTDSNEINMNWTIEYDLLDNYYRYLEVSVELLADNDPGAPGPIMLRDEIVDPETRPMLLSFPADFSLGTLGFSMETPTDKDSRSLEASGLWFALYSYDSIVITDTTGVQLKATYVNPRTLDIITTYWDCNGYNGLNECTLWVDVSDSVFLDPSYPYDTSTVDTANLADLAATLDTIGIICTTTVIDSYYIYNALMMDTFSYSYMEYEFVAFPVNVDSADQDTFFVDPCTGETTDFVIEPFSDYIHEIVYTGMTRDKSYLLDLFISSHEDLPDLYDTDWHYKGWILSPHLPDNCPELGRMTKPAWSHNAKSYFDQMFPGSDDWAIVSTGNFKSFEHADNSNPYSLNLRVPDYPGEDFINNLPCGVDSFYFSIGDTLLFGGLDSAVGDVFVTLEPDNFDFNTNFPFFLFTTPYQMPSYRMVSDTTVNHVQNFLLHNLSGMVRGNPLGFPRIWVELIRE